MQVKGIDHIHIVVKDMEKAVKLYEDIFGIKFGRDIILKEYDAISRLAPLGTSGIELIQPTAPGSLFAKFIEKKGEGIQAISFRVNDIEEAKKDMQSKGIRLADTVSIGKMKEAQYHPKDAHGVLIELIECPDIHPAEVAMFLL